MTAHTLDSYYTRTDSTLFFYLKLPRSYHDALALVRNTSGLHCCLKSSKKEEKDDEKDRCLLCLRRYFEILMVTVRRLIVWHVESVDRDPRIFFFLRPNYMIYAISSILATQPTDYLLAVLRDMIFFPTGSLVD